MLQALQCALESAFALHSETDSEKIGSLLKYLEFRFLGRHLKSGEPCIDYLVDCITRISGLNVDSPTLYASVLWRLYDVMESPKEEIEQLFGPVVASLSERVYEISSINYHAGEDTKAEHFSHLIFALAKDLRVIFILLVDRAHVLSVIDKYSFSDLSEIARECQEIYAPIANRLGIGRLKFELEDLSFRVLNPDIFFDLERKVKARTADRELYLEKVKGIIQDQLKKEKIPASIRGRLKHLTSIHKKMQVQQIPFDEVYDVVGIRVITDTVKECYEVLGIIHSLWKPIPKRFKDYIAMPKQNMYQSIHTSVIGPSAHPLEVQIRTREMDQISEIGIAAHWRYKERGLDRKSDEKFSWLRQLLDWTKEHQDPVEIMELLKVDLFPDEVYVFTPKGDVKCLPRGSTIVDFAYQIHSDIGNRCHGGKVNGRLVPLKSVLKNGDIVEIQLSSNATVNADWLGFVTTSSARSKIRRFIRDQERDGAIENGREILLKLLKKHKISGSTILNSDELLTIAGKLGYKHQNDLLAAVGFGEIVAQNIINKFAARINENKKSVKITKKVESQKSPKIRVANSNEILINFARCCEPLPGEEIVGYVTYGRGVTIHARRCAGLKKLESGRILEAHWESSDKPSYPLCFVFEGQFRTELILEINEILNQKGIVIISQNTRMVRKSRIRGEFVIELIDMGLFKEILQCIRALPGMTLVERTLSK